MRLIGLIGGITWQSTILYYEILNKMAIESDSDLKSARCLIHSLEFGAIQRYQETGRWDLLNQIMIDAGKSLEGGGASVIIICANTMHLCIDALRQLVSVPVIHIADVTASAIAKRGINNVALLGTKYTMEQPFFKDILKENGISSVIPNEEDRNELHRIIYEELAFGSIVPSSKEFFISMINRLHSEGAEGMILGCTELPLLVSDEEVSVPLFNTTFLHAEAAFANATME